eukprot:Nitzschia sp. Nitz4//scaffold34_size148208//28503//29660//NITZ4_002962-RA/size148208-augustus-gene-0.58-mRNA-1//1//CDS//3329548741//1178//frame0
MLCSSSFLHLTRRSASSFLPACSRLLPNPLLGASSHSKRSVAIPAEHPPNAVDEKHLMKDMLYRIRKLNYAPEGMKSMMVNFRVDGILLGKIFADVANILCETDVDTPYPIFVMKDGDLTFSDAVGTSVEARTEAVGLVMAQLHDDGIVSGWRDELFPVSHSFYKKPKFLIERACCSLLGVLEYGVHINGLVREHPDAEPKMWIGRRSKTKTKFGGMLDHIVAGGQPAGVSLIENVLKECEEEAGIPPEMALQCAKPSGAISYERWDGRRNKVNRAVIFTYDLYLPPDFVPRPVDGEVEEFFQWTINEVKEAMTVDYPDPMKPNCYSVIIDYLLRNGHVSPETPGYLDVLGELRNGDCR